MRGLLLRGAGVIVRSLWLCPNCLRQRVRMPAFSLHTPFVKDICCPTCGYHMVARVKPNARKVIPPRIRKVAFIGLRDAKDGAFVLRPLNDALLDGYELDIAPLLDRLKEQGVIVGWEYAAGFS